MSANLKITSTEITEFIAFVLSLFKDDLASDLEALHKNSNPGFYDYNFCTDNLYRDYLRAINKLNGVKLLFSDYLEVSNEIEVALKTFEDLYDFSFQEVQALQFPKTAAGTDKPTPSSSEHPSGTVENSLLESQPEKLPSVTPVMILALRFLKQNLDHKTSSSYSSQKVQIPRRGTLSALIRRGLAVKDLDNILIPSNIGLSIIDIDDNAIGG